MKEIIFNIGGYIQPSYRSESLNNSLFSSKSDNIYRSNNSVFFLKGKMKSEKLKSCFQRILAKVSLWMKLGCRMSLVMIFFIIRANAFIH